MKIAGCYVHFDLIILFNHLFSSPMIPTAFSDQAERDSLDGNLPSFGNLGNSVSRISNESYSCLLILCFFVFLIEPLD